MVNTKTDNYVNFGKLFATNLFVEFDNYLRVSPMDFTATFFGFGKKFNEFWQWETRECKVIVDENNNLTIIAPTLNELIYVIDYICEPLKVDNIFTIPQNPITLKD